MRYSHDSRTWCGYLKSLNGMNVDGFSFVVRMESTCVFSIEPPHDVPSAITSSSTGV